MAIHDIMSRFYGQLDGWRVARQSKDATARSEDDAGTELTDGHADFSELLAVLGRLTFVQVK